MIDPKLYCITEERAKELQALTENEKNYVHAFRHYDCDIKNIDLFVTNYKRFSEEYPGIELITPEDYDKIAHIGDKMRMKGNNDYTTDVLQNAIRSYAEDLNKKKQS